MNPDTRLVLRHIAKMANGGTMPPEAKRRAKRFTGKHSRRKRKALATMGGDTAEFLTSLEGRWLTRWRAAGGPEPVRQYQFAPPRKWRFDFAFPDRKLAVEIQGGTWNGGGHSRGSGQRRDAEKFNAAARLGWRLMFWTTDMIDKDIGFLEAVAA